MPPISCLFVCVFFAILSSEIIHFVLCCFKPVVRVIVITYKFESLKTLKYTLQLQVYCSDSLSQREITVIVLSKSCPCVHYFKL